MDRSTFASWLQGPRAASGAGEADGYAGQRLGLPPTGPGSVASFGGRLLALIIDWISCILVTLLFTRGRMDFGESGFGNLVLGVFALEVFLLTWLGGASFGQRLRRLRLARLDGRPLGLLRALVRVVLLCLVIPAVIVDRDGRGLHDRAAGTIVLRA